MSDNDAFNRQSYGRIANRYAQFRPEYPSALIAAVLQYVSGRELAYDCASGTGQAAKMLVPHFGRVIASDSSADQVRHIPPSVSRFVGRGEVLPVASRVVDLLTVAQAVHWLDLDHFWPEVQRVCRPGGVLAIWGYGFFTVSPEVDAVVMSSLRAHVDRYWGSGNLILLDEYRTISFPFEELPAPKIDIVSNWDLDRLLAYLGTWSALRRHEEEHGPGLLEQAQRELERVWPREEVREVRMPVTIRVGRI